MHISRLDGGRQVKRNWLFIVGITLLTACSALQCQTAVFNDSSVINANAHRLGGQIGSLDYYSNGNFTKNIFGNVDPGFEPALVQQTWLVTSTGTTTTIVDPDPYDPVFQNYFAGGTFTVVQSAAGSAALGCTGTITGNTGQVQITNGSASGTTVTFTTASASNFSVGQQYVVNNPVGGSNWHANYPDGTITSVSGTTVVATATTAPSGTLTGGQLQQLFVTMTTPACGAATQNGDIVLVSQLLSPTPSTGPAGWVTGNGIANSSASGGAAFLSDQTSLCATCGTQSLQLSAASGSLQFQEVWDSLNVNDWVLLNGTFQLSLWGKLISGTPTLTISGNRSGAANQFTCGTYTLSPTSSPALTSTWTQFTYTCTASEVGIASGNPSCVAGGTTSACTGVQTAAFTFSESGGVMDIDNVSLQQTGTSGSNTTIWRDAVMNGLGNFFNSSGSSTAPCTFRYWTNQNGETITNWTAPDYARLATAGGPGYGTGPAGGAVQTLSLNDYLNIVKALGCQPYLEIPVTLSTTDAPNLVEFLASTNTSTGFGARRAALGQTAPWTSVFNNFYITFCNECWNSAQSLQNIPPRSGEPNSEVYWDYSTRAAAIYAAMRASPSYSNPGVSSNIQLGFNAQTAINFSVDAGVQRSKPDFIEIENYKMSTSNNFSTFFATYPVEWYYMYNGPGSDDASNFYNSIVDYSGLSVCGSSGTAQCKFTMYEWGHGTNGGSLTQSQQDQADAGGATGVNDVASYLELQTLFPSTFITGNFFSTSEWSNGGNNGNTAKLWGDIVDFDGSTHNVRPQFLAMQAANAAIVGPQFACPISSNVTYSPAADPNNGTSVPPGVPAATNVPYLYVFCFKNGSQRGIVIANTDTVNTHPMSFSGTNTPASGAAMTTYAPPSVGSLNEAPTGTNTSTTGATVSLVNSTYAGGTLTLPADSIVTLVYNVSSTPTSNLVISGKTVSSGKVLMQ